jgi:hypothetical protein
LRIAFLPEGRIRVEGRIRGLQFRVPEVQEGGTPMPKLLLERNGANLVEPLDFRLFLQLRERGRCYGAADFLLPFLPGIASHIQCPVADVPRRTEGSGERGSPFRRRIKTVLETAHHPLPVCEKTPMFNRFPVAN